MSVYLVGAFILAEGVLCLYLARMLQVDREICPQCNGRPVIHEPDGWPDPTLCNSHFRRAFWQATRSPR